jgi:hypothetical protein
VAKKRTTSRRKKSTPTLAEIKKARERLVEEIEGLDGELDALELVLGLKGDASEPPPPGRKRFRNNQNLVKTLRKALRGKECTIKDAVVAVRELGYQTTSPNFRIIVNQTLCNHPKDFKRVRRGVYTSR